jgi:hypothetical protein
MFDAPAQFQHGQTCDPMRKQKRNLGIEDVGDMA